MKSLNTIFILTAKVTKVVVKGTKYSHVLTPLIPLSVVATRGRLQVGWKPVFEQDLTPSLRSREGAGGEYMD